MFAIKILALFLTILAQHGAGHETCAAPEKTDVKENALLKLQELYKIELNILKRDLSQLLNETNSYPIMLRLAWHDAGSENGAVGSIRFEEELNHGANAGLVKAVKLLEPMKQMHPLISWADIIQMAGALAVELTGGPKILMRYGRTDSKKVAKEGALPAAFPEDPAAHLRQVFNRMGFGDREIVALSGAHTIGRAHGERSGAVRETQVPLKGTKYTTEGHCPKTGKTGELCPFGNAGGRSWTKDWQKFSNSYFTEARKNKAGGKGGDGSDDDDLLVWLPTDGILMSDPGFAEFFELYAENEDLFFEDYREAHRRLSEQGVTWGVIGGLMIP